MLEGDWVTMVSTVVKKTGGDVLLCTSKGVRILHLKPKRIEDKCSLWGFCRNYHVAWLHPRSPWFRYSEGDACCWDWAFSLLLKSTWRCGVSHYCNRYILREAIHHRSSIRLRERILRINTLHRANILLMVSILRREVTRRKANPAIHPLRRLNQCPLRHP